MSTSAAQTARRKALSALPRSGPASRPGTAAAACTESLLGAYVWRRFFADVPWDERLLRASAGVRRGARSAFTLAHGAWELSLTPEEALVAHWVYGDSPARLSLSEFEARVESQLEPCQACTHQARFPRLRGWAEYRLPDGAAVFLCPDCVAAEPAAA